VLVVLATLAAIAAFGDFGATSSARAGALDPGPITNVHATFTADRGCAACHGKHRLRGIRWLAAAFGSHDQTGQCLTCHEFEGRDRAAHNHPEMATTRSGRPIPEPECATCHAEHKGAEFPISRVTNAVCTNCHEPKVTTFTGDHPTFPPAFPYQIPNNVNFNHAKHLDTYFAPDSKWVKQNNRDAEFARQARAACTTCHAIATASREVTPRPFEETCAKCHDHQLRERPLVLAYAAEPTPLMTFLLDLQPDEDEEAAAERLRQFFGDLAENGVAALAKRLTEHGADRPGERSGHAAPAALLEGLSDRLAKAAGTAWAEEDGELQDSETTEVDAGGWRAGEDDEGEQTLRYQPRRHEDPVVMAWVRLLRAARDGNDDEDASARAGEALDYLLDESSGVGACGKCHRAGVAGAGKAAAGNGGAASTSSKPGGPDRAPDLGAGWRLTGPSKRPYTTYSHRPHINLLGPELACRSCHTLNPEAKYGKYFETLDPANYVSNFHPIKKALCQRCHTEGRVTVACQTCHRYHREPGFRQEFEAKQRVPRGPFAGIVVSRGS